MKMMRKISALVLAIMMIMVVGAAFATSLPEDMDGEAGVIGEFTTADTPTPQTNSVLIYKEITAYNKNASTVNAPVLTYSYSIEPGSSSKSVTDAGGAFLHESTNSVAALTKAGPTGATISGSVDNGATYTSGTLQLTNTVQLTTADAGVANKFPLKVDFSRVTWSGAGVYRYKITESTVSGAKTAAGVTDGGIADVLYMDVYVKDASSGYEIYGYTCFKEDINIDGRTSTSNLSTVQKTEGFVTGDTDASGTVETDEQADKYYTFNLEISKTLVNDQAMNGHQFPFNVDFTNASVTTNILLKQETTAGGGITANLPAAAGVSGLDVADLKLANGAKVKYIGIPVGVTAATTVAVYEINDVTGTVYRSSYTVDEGTASTPKSLTWDSTGDANKSDVANLPTITLNADDDVSHTIAFTNTLELISPTGYVSRFAPYALILIGGVALLVIAMKRRKHTEED